MGALGGPWAQVSVTRTWEGVKEVHRRQCPGLCMVSCPWAVLLGSIQLVFLFAQHRRRLMLWWFMGSQLSLLLGIMSGSRRGKAGMSVEAEIAQVA